MSCEPADAGRLRRESVLNPVTALAFYTSPADGRQYLLAGEDADVEVYDARAARRRGGRLAVFRDQAVHGIAVAAGHGASPGAGAGAGGALPAVLVWGGHAVAVLSRDAIEAVVVGGAPGQAPAVAAARAPDWILDGRISPLGDGRVALLTAHNEVIAARADRRGGLVLGGARSPSRPILYAGTLAWSSADHVLVAAGTVFGEIIVWRCGLAEAGRGGGETGQGGGCEVLHVLAGHEGSIFGVRFSPEIRIPTGETLRLLASCSDDRTIRVWDVTERRAESARQRGENSGAGGVRGGYESHISDARETGFGRNVEAPPRDDDSTRCLAAAMGHASRIWQVEFQPSQPSSSQTANTIDLYSFGEDATTQKWSLLLDPQPPTATELGVEKAVPGRARIAARLTHQSTFANHSGKHIWSHAMVAAGSGDPLIATGGADGKIATIGGSGGSRDASVDNTSYRGGGGGRGGVAAWPLADVLRSCHSGNPPVSSRGKPGGTPKNAKEGFNRYTFVSERRLLAATNSGRVFVGTFDDADDLSWAELALPDEIGQVVFSHALPGAVEAGSVALIGAANGDIYAYAEPGSRPLEVLTRVDGKVADIFCLSNGACPQFLVTMLRSARAVIVQIDAEGSDAEHVQVALEAGFMVTAAAFAREHLALGSRKGVLAVFRRGEDGNYARTLALEVHPDEAITSILPLRSRARNCILTTYRDGKYRIHEIAAAAADDRDGAALQLQLLHETSPPFASSVEGAWFAGAAGPRDLMLCGFRSNSFLVWNETRRREVVAAVDCGGASRSYAWAPLPPAAGTGGGGSGDGGGDGFRFAFTKAGRAHVFSRRPAPRTTLREGGHGREIKAASASASGRYVATAAEDTVIRIWERRRGGSRRFRSVAALERHAAGVQALRWRGDEYLLSSGGNEEFFVWRVRRLGDGDGDDLAGLAVVCEAVFADRTAAGDARITDFDVDAASATAPPAFRVSMALSNSTLQTYAYARATGFRLLARRAYTGACLTQVRHLGASHVLAAATDGHLAVWALPAIGGGADDEDGAANRPALVARLHQSTIKALDVRRVPAAAAAAASEAYLVVTGGDDNALGFALATVAAAPPAPRPPSAPGARPRAAVALTRRCVVRAAHAAATTGVAIARLGRAGDDALVVSASSDQRVRVWRLRGWRPDGGGGGAPRAQLLDERYSSVADAGALEVFGEDSGRDRADGRQEKAAVVVVVVAGVGMEVWELDVR
ncbi:WD40 repeat-like protein [Durotheca rogersii]|uniref:WD40 repeat-like protein n=1 Tax=Durotheca rogersii TaxID=419775 RepID=UPI00221F02A5|nr:WD40 repeat-like protein [Durotheca rogersii]KAI5864774.1 WD40 repeat-like protein [Durotheca rogersii]